MPGSHFADDNSQQIHMVRQQIIGTALQKIDGEEVRATRMPCASIVGYARVLRRLTGGAIPFGYCALRGLVLPKPSCSQ
jgi:hypothetical protein